MAKPFDSGARRFRRLPKGVRHHTVQIGREIAQRMSSHLLQILIGPLATEAGTIKTGHGSAVAVQLRGKLYAATACHVVEEYVRRRRSGEEVRFQLGNTIIDAENLIAWKDEAADLAFLRITAHQATSTGREWWVPPRWPPRLPNEGDFVAFCGFPNELRADPTPARVNLAASGGILRVSSQSATRAIAVMDRTRLVGIDSYVPDPEAEMGGMSGGPVFRAAGNELELVGVVTDFGSEFQTFILGLWGGVNLDDFVR